MPEKHIKASWSSILDAMKSHPDMSSEQYLQLEKAFAVLKEHLGQNFPAQVDSREHPLALPLVHNKAAFPKKWISWFADAIEKLSDQKNFQALVRKLQNSQQFHECFDYVRFSYRLALAEWGLEFEPKLAGRKHPDLLCTSPAGIELLVEISSLGESDKQKISSYGMVIMLGVLSGLSINYVTCGRLLMQLKESDYGRIEKKSHEFKNRLLKSNNFTVHKVAGLLEICGAPKSMNRLVDDWANQRDLKIGSYAYDSGIDELLRRTTGRLKKKSTQISEFGLPGLIALNCNQFTNDGELIEQRSTFLIDELKKYPDIIGLIIFGSMWRGSRNVHFQLPNIDYIEVIGSIHETEEWVIIHNPHSCISEEIRDSLLEEICSALVGKQAIEVLINDGGLSN